MKPYYLLLDVGGTEIKMNALTVGNEFLYVDNKHYPSYSQKSKAEILSHFEHIMFNMMTDVEKKGYVLAGIGLAFPGPFNYKEGFSLMQGFRKYESIYLVNLKEMIRSWLTERDRDLVPIVFENDATCFALGEYHNNKDARKGIYLTLGTGCGSTFIEHQHIVKSGYGLNEMGMLYDTPYKEDVLDAYLSVNGLRWLAKDMNYPFKNGKLLADDAEAGDSLAKELYIRFGEMIGEGIKPFIQSFQPDEVVFGGQISKSMALFKPGIVSEWGDDSPLIRVSEDTTTATLNGIYYVLKDKQKENTNNG